MVGFSCQFGSAVMKLNSSSFHGFSQRRCWFTKSSFGVVISLPSEVVTQPFPNFLWVESLWWHQTRTAFASKCMRSWFSIEWFGTVKTDFHFGPFRKLSDFGGTRAAENIFCTLVLYPLRSRHLSLFCDTCKSCQEF